MLFEGLGNAIHLIAAVVLVGGLLVLVAGLRPAFTRAFPSEMERERVLSAVHRRFVVLAGVAAVILLATGFMMMTQNQQFHGFGHYDNAWSKLLLAKHVLFVGMIVLLVLLRSPRPVKIENDLVELALLVGVAILAVTGFLTAAKP